jgi:hypothetical protein
MKEDAFDLVLPTPLGRLGVHMAGEQLRAIEYLGKDVLLKPGRSMASRRVASLLEHIFTMAAPHWNCPPAAGRYPLPATGLAGAVRHSAWYDPDLWSPGRTPRQWRAGNWRRLPGKPHPHPRALPPGGGQDRWRRLFRPHPGTDDGAQILAAGPRGRGGIPARRAVSGWRFFPVRILEKRVPGPYLEATFRFVNQQVSSTHDDRSP